ncbi:MAG: acyl-CoA dehydrogenase [Planctomycetota bacterium]
MHGWYLSHLVIGVVSTPIVLLALGYVGARAIPWTVGALALGFLWGLPWWALLVVAAIGAVTAFVPLRRRVVTQPVMSFMRAMKFLPVISRTEREALEAGTVWVDGELFGGRPDVHRLAKEPLTELTPEEQAFLDDQVERVCAMTSDWDVFQHRDLPQDVWRTLREEGFFGLLIPREYQGRGFSAEAKSRIIAKLSSRCGPLGITVMVPNSLGPAELLLHHGTQEQRDHWLPRLAKGIEVPCFALTEPNAGSDAGSMTSHGEVFRGDDGELYLRLTWRKRYITLAAISTVLGLAFKLHDPNEFLGKGKDPGITCALIPTNTPGVVLGERHDPLGVPFYNCPTSGDDVVVPVSAIIGGAAGAGRGWQMLMECLSAGRGIALPASSTASAKGFARIAGAYSLVRQQFGVSIGAFEGIAEPLSRIGAAAYELEAARRFTTSGIDAGHKPAVITALLKYCATETSRRVTNDTMDILGGAAISRGPRNLVAHAYFAQPISITVEGANILTRTLMIFGQGAIRSHPYAYKEIRAMEERDVAGFDAAFFGHVGHVVRNLSRSIVLTLTRGALAPSPVSGPTARYWRKLGWTSATFATLADFAMAGLGGNLKRKEALSGRFADMFVEMYLATAVLRRFEADGRPREDLPFVRLALDHSFARVQRAMEGLLTNLTIPGMRWFFAGPVRWLHRLAPIGTEPTDELAQRVAELLQEPGPQRERLFGQLYMPTSETEPVRALETAFEKVHAAHPVVHKVKKAMKKGKVAKRPILEALPEAVTAGVIEEKEAAIVRAAEEARAEAIEVDAFSLEDYMKTAIAKGVPVPESHVVHPEHANYT